MPPQGAAVRSLATAVLIGTDRVTAHSPDEPQRNRRNRRRHDPTVIINTIVVLFITSPRRDAIPYTIIIIVKATTGHAVCRIDATRYHCGGPRRTRTATYRNTPDDGVSPLVTRSATRTRRLCKQFAMTLPRRFRHSTNTFVAAAAAAAWSRHDDASLPVGAAGSGDGGGGGGGSGGSIRPRRGCRRRPKNGRDDSRQYLLHGICCNDDDDKTIWK